MIVTNAARRAYGLFWLIEIWKFLAALGLILFGWDAECVANGKDVRLWIFASALCPPLLTVILPIGLLCLWVGTLVLPLGSLWRGIKRNLWLRAFQAAAWWDLISLMLAGLGLGVLLSIDTCSDLGTVIAAEVFLWIYVFRTIIVAGYLPLIGHFINV